MMTQNDYKIAAKFWLEQDEKSTKMSATDVKQKAFTFIGNHNTCALGTGTGDFVRVTPLEYTWLDEAFYIISEGGEKFVGLAKNNNVSLAIFEPYSGFGKISSIQVTGKARVIDFGADEYLKVLEFKKIPVSSIEKIGHPMYLIKVVPTKMDLLFSEFKKSDFSPRQQLVIK